MNTYQNMLDQLDEHELELFEKDLKDGHIQKYIIHKKEYYNIKNKSCPICGNNVSEDCFVLIWGAPSIRKKAHFCGVDCLEYFFQKKLKTVPENTHNQDKIKNGGKYAS